MYSGQPAEPVCSMLHPTIKGGGGELVNPTNDSLSLETRSSFTKPGQLMGVFEKNL